MLVTDLSWSLSSVLRMWLLVLSVCRPGRAMLTADWRALGSSRPGSRAQERARYLDTLGEILCLPLIRTPWAVEVVTRETCDSIRLTLRHQTILSLQ